MYTRINTGHNLHEYYLKSKRDEKFKLQGAKSCKKIIFSLDVRYKQHYLIHV